MLETSYTPADLEALWAGDFGNAYLDRNKHAGGPRAAYWADFLDTYPAVSRTLEIGCTQGDNLMHFTPRIPAHELWGLDVNPVVLESLRTNVPGCNGVWGVARALPFRDAYFDLVLTVGLLIHQPDETLPIVMNEMVRTSRKYIYCGEYHSDEGETIEYRGHTGILFKRNYKQLFADMFPELTLVGEGFLTKETGFDRVTWLMYEKP